MKANCGKCQAFIIKQNQTTLKIDNITHGNNTYEYLLKIKVDIKVNFNEHELSTIDKTDWKVNPWYKIFWKIKQRQILHRF